MAERPLRMPTKPPATRRSAQGSAPSPVSALGGLATAVVVATFEDAERAARVVDEKRFGRCTFLALDTVAPARAPIDGSVASRVRCSEQMRPIVAALLGESVVALDLAAATMCAPSCAPWSSRRRPRWCSTPTP